MAQSSEDDAMLNSLCSSEAREVRESLITRAHNTQTNNERQGPRHSKIFVGILIIVVLVSRTGPSILTPLWIDALGQPNSTASNSTNAIRHVDSFAIMFIVTFVYLVLFALTLLLCKIFLPHWITTRETSYPKSQFALVGVADAVSGLCFVYASSGTRTAPYLQAIVSNFYVPVTFVIRFILLRKRPTCRKATCALLVLVAEFTALTPSIFPDLQTEESKKDDGGAPGVEGVLWSLCFFFGYIPLALVTVVLEKAVQKQSPGASVDSTNQLNVAYVLFWCYLFTFLTLILLFWTDIVDGFGMTSGIEEFVQVFWFNIKCYVGLEGCLDAVLLIEVFCTALMLISRVINTYFLRYMEGANYLSIILSLQTPIVFIFFTLFDEDPLVWHPHAHLTTWLSIVALCIMIPAIYIYDTGAPEVVPTQRNQAIDVGRTREVEVQTDEPSDDPRQPLLGPKTVQRGRNPFTDSPECENQT